MSTKVDPRDPLAGIKPSDRICVYVAPGSGKPCTQNALEGFTTCRRHTSAHPSALGRKQSLVPGYYSRVLGDTLGEAFEEAREIAPSEALQLHEEIALARAITRQSLALLKAVKSDNVVLRVQIMESVKKSMEHVRKMVETAAKVDAFAKDHVPVSHMRLVVDQMVEIFHHFVGEDEEVVQAFKHELRHRVKLPRGDDKPRLDVEIRRLTDYAGTPEQRKSAMEDVREMVGLKPTGGNGTGAKEVQSVVVGPSPSLGLGDDDDDVYRTGEGPGDHPSVDEILESEREGDNEQDDDLSLGDDDVDPSDLAI